MLNYYELFDVSPSATTDEIKKVIHQQMRLWSHRTNAPQMERRQEAERMVRILEEMEEILLDESKRKEYDEQLRLVLANSATDTSTGISPVNSSSSQEATATVEQKEKLSPEEITKKLEEGKQLYSREQYEESLEIAKELAEHATDRPEVWALLGRSRFQLGDLHEAISPLVKACDLDSQNPSYVYDLGLVFEKQENYTRALEQFKLAYSLDQGNLEYKFKLGVLSVKLNNFQVALSMLEQCYQAVPNHSQYQQELANAYLQASFSKWKTIHSENPYLSPGQYPITKADLELASNYIERASRIPVNDPELQRQIQQRKEEIKKKKGRQFTGSWIMVVLSTIFLILIQLLNPSYLNIAFISLPLFYILSAFTPKYVIYRRVDENKCPKTDFAQMFDRMKKSVGSVGAWLISTFLVIGYFFITPFVLSIVIIYNFIRKLI